MAHNVRALRRARGMELSGLAARLEVLGQPIGVPGLSRLENGERRVDVDDLMAISLALEVTPLRLLLPGTAREDAPAALTAEISLAEVEAWEWAMGGRPLPQLSDPEMSDVDRMNRFRMENRPHRTEEALTIFDIQDHAEGLRRVTDAAQRVVDEGITWENVHAYIEFVRHAAPIYSALGRDIHDPSRRLDDQPQ